MIKDRWAVDHLSVIFIVKRVCLRDLEGTLIHENLGSVNDLDLTQERKRERICKRQSFE